MNQNVLITGATGGIGSAIAEAFAKNGYNIGLHYHANEKKATALKKQLETYGVQVEAVKGNIADFEASKDIITAVEDALGPINVLVNNAGLTKDTLMLRMKETDFDAVVDVNLKGTWNMCKHVTRGMLKRKSGKIINISSVVGIIGNAGQVNYAATKAGLIGLTKSLAKEFGKKQINVNCVAPGFIETKMTEQLNDDVKASYKSQIPLNRFGKPEDVANVVLFLASEQASYMTGQTISVNGGMV